METNLKNYTKFIETKTDEKLSVEKRTELQIYHAQMLANFQHERLIHLFVTLFFALFLILFFVFTTLLTILAPSAHLLFFTSAGVTLVLLLVTVFYVRHYYLLENGVQRLYKTTEKLSQPHEEKTAKS
jgi:ABC-type polysaccharide/polyol phosphate export permease